MFPETKLPRYDVDNGWKVCFRIKSKSCLHLSLSRRQKQYYFARQQLYRFDNIL